MAMRLTSLQAAELTKRIPHRRRNDEFGAGWACI